MPETAPKTPPNIHGPALLNMGEKWDNYSMEQLIETLREIGLPADEVERICIFYNNDPDGLRSYVLYMRAVLDDRHEYI